ncbi:MAG: hypothetical protein H3C49_11710 [Alphaproteobacteria bacterium]|nr:hypothetical protein [Alphaproteobacteria bacterium]
MKNESGRGRAQLRDVGPAAGVYEVDYTIYAFVQHYKQVGGPPIAREVFSADVRSVNGYLLRNGLYELKRDSGKLCKLRKTGAVWELLAD